MTEIGSEAFAGCTALSSITIPESVTSIRSYTFSGCTSLSNITIPESVTEIGEGAFYGCISLTSIYVKANTPPQLGRYAFKWTSYKLYVPNDYLAKYKAADGWSGYADYIVGYDYENDKVVE